jgi:crooked neck
LKIWKAFEQTRGTEEDVAKVEGMMPIVGKRRHVDHETGEAVEGMSISSYVCGHSADETYTDHEYVFLDDERESNPTSFKFLQSAHAWAQAKKSGAGGTSSLPGFTAPRRDQTESTLDEGGGDAKSDVASSDGEAE